uniref:Uncharacterized protein n=1 Tax=Populus trichocarpa TaxID=3694 RepID=A0A2K1YZI1_POPTR
MPWVLEFITTAYTCIFLLYFIHVENNLTSKHIFSSRFSPQGFQHPESTLRAPFTFSYLKCLKYRDYMISIKAN